MSGENTTFLRTIGNIFLFLAVLVLLARAPALTASEAPGAHEPVNRAQGTSESRKMAARSPGLASRSASGSTTTTGWSGGRRIHLKTKQTKNGTETRGWDGDTYIHVKERKDD